MQAFIHPAPRMRGGCDGRTVLLVLVLAAGGGLTGRWHLGCTMAARADAAGVFTRVREAPLRIASGRRGSCQQLRPLGPCLLIKVPVPVRAASPRPCSYRCCRCSPGGVSTSPCPSRPSRPWSSRLSSRSSCPLMRRPGHRRAARRRAARQQHFGLRGRRKVGRGVGRRQLTGAAYWCMSGAAGVAATGTTRALRSGSRRSHRYAVSRHGQARLYPGRQVVRLLLLLLLFLLVRVGGGLEGMAGSGNGR